MFLSTARGFLNNPDKAVIFFHVGSLVVFTSPLGFLGFFRSSIRLFLHLLRIGSLVGHQLDQWKCPMNLAMPVRPSVRLSVCNQKFQNWLISFSDFLHAVGNLYDIAKFSEKKFFPPKMGKQAKNIFSLLKIQSLFFTEFGL